MNKKKLILVIAVAIALVAALVIGGIALLEKEETESPADIAEHNRQVLEEAKNDEENLEEGVVSSKEATYEEWLSAAAVTGVSLKYPDFELEGIYSDSETDLNDFEKSDGIYIKFKAEGKFHTVSCHPLEEERTKKGTTDIYEQMLGYATFDEVKESKIPKEAKEIDVKSLDSLMKKVTLVSLYENL